MSIYIHPLNMWLETGQVSVDIQWLAYVNLPEALP